MHELWRRVGPPSTTIDVIMGVVMIVTGVAFAVMGAAAIVRPAMVPAQFGAGAETAEIRTEVRAVYGGFGLAMAALLIGAAATSSSYRDGVALTVGIALAGMAVGRAVGAVLERPQGVYPTVAFLLGEAVAAAALVVGVLIER